jgi:hypothetical protein
MSADRTVHEDPRLHTYRPPTPSNRKSPFGGGPRVVRLAVVPDGEVPLVGGRPRASLAATTHLVTRGPMDWGIALDWMDYCPRVDLRVRIGLWASDFLIGGLLGGFTWFWIRDCPRSKAEARARREEYRRRRLAKEFVSRGDLIGMTLIGAWSYAFLMGLITVGTVVVITRIALAGG